MSVLFQGKKKIEVILLDKIVITQQITTGIYKAKNKI